MFEALATAIDELEISVDEQELLAALALRDRLSARVTLAVGEFVHSFGDVHLYNNHFDQAREQLGVAGAPDKAGAQSDGGECGGVGREHCNLGDLFCLWIRGLEVLPIGRIDLIAALHRRTPAMGDARR